MAAASSIAGDTAAVSEKRLKKAGKFREIPYIGGD
jgi:hypothetical protein